MKNSHLVLSKPNYAENQQQHLLLGTHKLTTVAIFLFFSFFFCALFDESNSHCYTFHALNEYFTSLFIYFCNTPSINCLLSANLTNIPPFYFTFMWCEAAALALFNMSLCSGSCFETTNFIHKQLYESAV